MKTSWNWWEETHFTIARGLAFIFPFKQATVKCDQHMDGGKVYYQCDLERGHPSAHISYSSDPDEIRAIWGTEDLTELITSCEVLGRLFGRDRDRQ